MLNTAIEIAKANDVYKLPSMGAVLAYRGKVKAVGLNKRKTHPLAKRFQKHPEAIELHAEIDVIKNALKDYTQEEISKFTLYIARVLKDGTPALAAPCEGCQSAIAAFGIKKVIWTT